ncbi:hypothetical protein [Streptomyces sp. NPDC059224]|uniref:hypothetical protein n=1 Tax=Streptomyces sp. NPDC059224 TaxID=3346775 RepID=UPI00367B9EDD
MSRIDLVSAAQVFVTVLVVLRMIWVGFLRESGKILSWPMFTLGSSVIVDLRAGDAEAAEEVNIFEVLPSGEFAISLSELQLVVDYVSTEHGQVNGTGRMLWAEGEKPITVEDSHVVA